MGLDFIQTLLHSLQKHNLELITCWQVTDGTPTVTSSINGIVSPLQTYAPVKSPE